MCFWPSGFYKCLPSSTTLGPEILFAKFITAYILKYVNLTPVGVIQNHFSFDPIQWDSSSFGLQVRFFKFQCFTWETLYNSNSNWTFIALNLPI